MDISIIIPNLHSPIVDQTILSLLHQKTQYTYEIVIVGQDRFKITDQFVQDNVQFIETEKPTPPGIARNIGVKSSTGNYIFFIDSDCVASPHWINLHMDLHKNNQYPIVVGGGVSFSTETYFELIDNISTFHEYMLHINSGEKKQLPSLNMSLSRSLWNTTKGFNDNLVGEDAEFTTSLLFRGIKLFFSPLPLIIHKPNRNSFHDVMFRAFRFGKYSVNGKKEYQHELKLPFILRNWILTMLFSPFISGFLLLRIILIEKLPFRYWHTLPIIFLAKILWCIGFANQIHTSSRR